MRSFLIACILAFASSVAAQGTMLAVYNSLSRIDEINRTTGASISQQALTSTVTIFGFTGLAQDPTTGILYAAVRTQPTAADIFLGTINRTAGTVTLIGEFNVASIGESISSIQFDSTGQLWAISGVPGSGTPNPERLFTVNKATAAMTSFVGLGNGQASEALGFDPTNSAVLYHYTGQTAKLYETVDRTTGGTTPITITNPPSGSQTILCMAYDSSTSWFWTCTNANEYGYIRPNGTYVGVLGTTAAPAKGMVVLPTIFASQTNLNLGTTTQGTAGSAQSFNLSGSNLFGNVTITPPTGVEVSLSAASGYATSLNVAPAASGQLASTQIFVRIAATAPVGAITGNVALTATGSDGEQVAVTGTVNTPPAPEMDVTRGGAIADGGTDAAGSMLVGVPQSLTYTITNSGNATLNMSNAVLGAITNCTPSITTQVPATLAAAANTSLVISVTPTTAAAFSFTVSITNDDATENPYNWTVSGTGLPNVPEMDVTRSATPIADASTDAIGNTTVGTPQALTYTITNSGTNTLNLTNATPGALNNCTVNVTTQPPATVAAAANAPVVVEVTALTPAAFSFTLSIGNDDPNENPYNWTVSGTGVAFDPEMDVLRGATPIGDGTTDAVGNRTTGSAFSLTYDIDNTGPAALTLIVPVVPTGSINCTVTVTSQPSASVAASGTTTLVLSVTPTADGPFSFSISIDNDDANEDPYDFTVSGTAQAGGQIPSDAKEGSEGNCSSGSETAWLWLLILLTFGSALLWRLKRS
jgi:hypothetical protein